MALKKINWNAIINIKDKYIAKSYWGVLMLCSYMGTINELVTWIMLVGITLIWYHYIYMY